MLKIRNLLIAVSGGLAVIFFNLALLIGGDTLPGYSQLSNEISVLFAAQSPARAFLMPFLLVYVCALVCFAAGLFFKSKSWMVKLGAFFILMKAVASAGVWLYPMDHIGPPLTTQGAIHLFFVGLMAVSVILGMIILGIAFRHMAHMQWLYPVSLILAIFLASSAAWGVLGVMTRNILLGFYERLPFTTFFVWVLLLGFGVLSSDNRIKHYFPFFTPQAK